jgi:hypothetical protein
MDENSPASRAAVERAQALLRDAGIVLSDDEIVALADGLVALQRLLDIVRSRPEP